MTPACSTGIGKQGPISEPIGSGSNWGLEASRVPFAWDFLEAIQRRGTWTGVQTALIDTGFAPHRDLPNLMIGVPDPGTGTGVPLCRLDPSGAEKCWGNNPITLTEDHGNLSAGALGARSGFAGGGHVGITGVNPLAQMSGLPYRNFSLNLLGGAAGLNDEAMEITDTLLNEVGPSGRLPRPRQG